MFKLHFIKSKLILLIVLITIIPVLLIGYFLLNKSINVMSSELHNSSLNTLSYIQNDFEQVIENLDVLSTVLLVDEQFKDAISQDISKNSKIENYNSYKLIHESIGTIKNTNNMISSIYLYDIVNKRGFSTEVSGYFNELNLDEFGWIEWRNSFNDTFDWQIADDPIGLKYNGKNRKLITAPKNITSQGGTNAILYINVDQTTLDSKLKAIEISGGANLFIFNSDNKIITCTDYNDQMDFDKLNVRNNLPSQTFIQLINGRDYFIGVSISEETGWKYIYTIPKELAFDNVNRLSTTIILVSVISIIIVFFFSAYLYGIMYNPIQLLMESMDRNKNGEVYLCPQIKNRDEFYLLIDNFNMMVTKVDRLNKNLFRSEIATKNTQIKLLQSQINPHFLYNTLDTINWIAKLNKVKEISELTYYMAKYYRMSLNEGKELISVSEAIDLAQSYVNIQRFRFTNIDIHIDVEDGLMDCKIIKRVFQPIFENAIIHGMTVDIKNGLIILTGIDLKDKMKFIIEDNGVGISEEKLIRLNRNISNSKFDDSGNFALKNLNSQIKLLYGKPYGIEINSKLGDGTTVTIVLPKKTEFREVDQNV